MAALVKIRNTLTALFTSAFLSFLATLLIQLFIHTRNDPSRTIVTKWAAAQWLLPLPIAHQWQEEAWKYWGEEFSHDEPHYSTIREMPVVNVQEFRENSTKLLPYLDSRWGKDWITRPLLLQNLWDVNELQSNTSRRLSRNGLLQEVLTIPYFTDARKYGALSPDAKAPIKDIVANITRGEPHKIGSQLLVQKYPDLIKEVAPVDIVTHLFGEHFSVNDVKLGAFGIPFLPSLTTVPLFVAASAENDNTEWLCNEPSIQSDDHSYAENQQCNAFTALHCEPIGNVAVQLEGERQWTFVSPQFSFWVKPTISPDGRAYFASDMASDEELKKVPRYYALQRAGDAVFVPPWFWHRVDYTSSAPSKSDDYAGKKGNVDIGISIGASLFHLRPGDFVRNNPLFAALAIPNLVKEALGLNTQ